MRLIEARTSTRAAGSAGLALVALAAFAASLFSAACQVPEAVSGESADWPDPTMAALAATVDALARPAAAAPSATPAATLTAVLVPVTSAPAPSPASSTILAPVQPAVADGSAGSSLDISAASPYVLFNQRWVQGLHSELDLTDIEAVFGLVFSRLPDDVIILPTENYYYYILYAAGRQVWGNFRLAANQRDEGKISFAAFEFTDFPSESSSSFTRYKVFSAEDGVDVRKVDRFTYTVTFGGKSVTFHLNQIPQVPPRLFTLGPDEAFVQRNFDESGFQFFLLFNTKKNYFFWVLNEEERLPDQLEPIADDVLLGKISGFAFWVDREHGDRKVLASVSRSHAGRNDYFDGPFDQVADNYAADVNYIKYLELAYPYSKGYIDKYGNFLNSESQRIGITTYYVHNSRFHLLDFMNRMREADDPYFFISDSRKELLKQRTPVATPATAQPSAP